MGPIGGHASSRATSDRRRATFLPVTRIIAVANQKGGVAKTTTVHAIASALVERGRSVLTVDLDPQASLTYAMGIEGDDLDTTLHDVMMGRASVDDVLWESHGIDLVPSSIDLAGAEVHLITRTGREYVLDRALRPVEERYDYVITEFYRLKDTGVSLAQRVANARYMLPTADTRLTLITCWPPTNNTHRLVVIAVPHHSATLSILQLIRARNPQAEIIVRSRYERHVPDLMSLGVQVVGDEHQVGLAMADQIRSWLNHLD